MRYIAAYLLARLGGNDDPKSADLEKIMGSVGVDFDSAAADKLINDLSGKDLAEIMLAGREKMSAMPSGAATDWVQDDDRQNMFGSKRDAGPAVLLRVPGGPQSVFGAPK